MSHGDVDTAYLDAARQAVLRDKRRSYELLALAPGMAVLDVGCGPATDTLALAELAGPSGRVVGVDHDPEMVATANARAKEADLADRVSHQLGEAADLPFTNGTFDASRSDRVFQHLPNPAAALAEMVRVTRSGGTVEVMDMDWGTLALDSTELEIVQRTFRFMLDQRLITNPYSGRTLYRLFREAGLDDVRVEPRPFQETDLGRARYLSGIDRVQIAAVEAGVLTEAEVERSQAALEQANDKGTLFGTGMMLLATGTRS